MIDEQILRSRSIGGEEKIHLRRVAVNDVAFKSSRGPTVNHAHGIPTMEGFKRANKIGYRAIRGRNIVKIRRDRKVYICLPLRFTVGPRENCKRRAYKNRRRYCSRQSLMLFV